MPKLHVNDLLLVLMNDAFVSLATKMLVDMAMHFFKSTNEVYICSKFKRGKHRQIGFFYNARIYALEMPKFTMDFSNEFFPPRLYLF
jgi:hypothetical protein